MLDTTKAAETVELRDECKQFVDRIGQFQGTVGGLIELVTNLSKAVEAQKLNVSCFRFKLVDCISDRKTGSCRICSQRNETHCCALSCCQKVSGFFVIFISRNVLFISFFPRAAHVLTLQLLYSSSISFRCWQWMLMSRPVVYSLKPINWNVRAFQAIGSRNLLKSSHKQRENAKLQLASQIVERQTTLERLRVQHSSLTKQIGEQEQVIEGFSMQK